MVISYETSGADQLTDLLDYENQAHPTVYTFLVVTDNK